VAARGADVAAAGGPAVAVSGVAHSEQKRAVGALLVPQAGQTEASRAAQLLQNFAPAGFSEPQFAQIIVAGA
jgi:hypothetical protein